jgi:hypothetical protein
MGSVSSMSEPGEKEPYVEVLTSADGSEVFGSQIVVPPGPHNPDDVAIVITIDNPPEEKEA